MPEVIIVNLNPALDRTAIVKKYNPFGVNKAERLVVLAGGKGANVGRALKTLGYNDFVCSGIIGGEIGKIFQKRLEGEQINNDYFWIKEETRIAYATYEESLGVGMITNEVGPEVTSKEIESFSKFLVEKYLPLVKTFVISGGAPPSFPPDQIYKLVSIFKKGGKEIFIDTSGKILELCSQLGAFCIKINEDELKGAFNVDINDRKSLIDLYISLHQTGTRWLIITRGEKGAIFIDGDRMIEGVNKKLYSKYSIGSGDAFYSAVIYGKVKGLPSEEILKLAMACGTANTLSFGGCIFKIKDVERIKKEIDIKRLLM